MEIDLSTDDNLSGVRDITLPDGSVGDATQAKYTVDKNGVYNFSVRDYCGNVLTYPVEVSNIDLLAPNADYEVIPSDWTNKPVTIHVTAIDRSRRTAMRPAASSPSHCRTARWWKAIPRIYRECQWYV